MANNQAKRTREYITTTQMAEMCGVSRFTIINWVKQRKITTIKTAGNHRRILLGESLRVLESLSLKNQSPESQTNCWMFHAERAESGKCRNCLIYKRHIDACFLLVRLFGQEKLGSGGICCECGYYDGVWKGRDGKFEVSDCSTAHGAGEGPLRSARNFLGSTSYSIGHGARQIKEGLTRLKNNLESKRKAVG